MGITNASALNAWLDAQIAMVEGEGDRTTAERYVDVVRTALYGR